MENIKVSLVQMDSTDNKKANFQKAEKFIVEAAEQNADIICFSENFLYRGTDRVKEAETLDSKYIQAFRALAKKHHTNLILGSIALAIEGSNKTTNTSLVINRNGEIAHRYDKIYLYNVERDDYVYHESNATEAGSELGFFELDGVKIGLGICVDLRYPEYFRELIKLGAEVIFLPSNFRKITGKTAWNILPKARAIENQLYFCACSQTGGMGDRETCGNSHIISFDGNILAEIDEEEGLVMAELNFENLRKFRQQFPVLKQIK